MYGHSAHTAPNHNVQVWPELILPT
eukprot:SAG11_NODE_18268_length_495_cov_8.681818_1_plen_24_part_01